MNKIVKNRGKALLGVIALAMVAMFVFVNLAQAKYEGEGIRFKLLTTDCEDDYWAGKENLIYDYEYPGVTPPDYYHADNALGHDDQYWDWWGYDKSFTGYRRFSEVSFDTAHDWDPTNWNCGGGGLGCTCDQTYYFKGLPSDGHFILKIDEDNNLSYPFVDILSYALPPGKKAPEGAILEQLSDFPSWVTEGEKGSSGTYDPDTNYFTAQINLNIDFKQSRNQNAWIENSHQFGYIIPKEEFGDIPGNRDSYPIPIYGYDPDGGGLSTCGDEPYSGTPNAGKYPGEYVPTGTTVDLNALDSPDDTMGWLEEIISLSEVADADYLYIGIQRDNFLRDETCVTGKHPDDGGNLHRLDAIEWPILGKDFLNYEGVWVAAGKPCYYLNYYPDFPYRERENDNYSGPASMQMLIDNYRPEELVPSQDELNDKGHEYNQSCNSGIPYVDPDGMKGALNFYLHNTHGGTQRYANYGVGAYDDVDDALHYICYWQHLGPGVVPTTPGEDNSDYSQWVVIRGIHTSVNPYTHSEYDIYGFWINDPRPGKPGLGESIGENSYKTVEEWTATYYKPLANLEPGDKYEGQYVAVCEPPVQPDAEVNLIPSPARFDRPITPVAMEKPILNKTALVEELDEEDSLDVVKAAIDGVTEELIPYDPHFATTFNKTVAGEPLMVKNDGADYYLLPFNLPIKENPGKYEIQKLDKGSNVLKVIKKVDGKLDTEVIPINSIKVNEKNTLVVVLIDAKDGSFKEASWVDEPVKYLPISKEEALKLVLSNIRPTKTKPMIELVNKDSSPYYPDWKITIGGNVYYVSQDGTVTFPDKPGPQKPVKPFPGKAIAMPY